MMRKKNNDWVLAALLVLALFGKGALATPRAPNEPGTPGTPGQSGAPGKNNSPDPGGVNSKDSPGDPSLTGNGVPDKSKMQGQNMSNMPPLFTMPTDNAGVKFATKETMFIDMNPVFKMMNGLSLIPGLPTVSGDPGASVTTTVYNPRTMKYETFTNNELLFPMSSAPPKAPGATISETNKQSSSPLPVIAVSQPKNYHINLSDQLGGGGSSSVMVSELGGLVDPNAQKQMNIKPIEMIMKMIMPMTMKELPSGAVPPTPTIPNPLSKQVMQDPLQMLLMQGAGFGQEALNKLLQGGNALTGLFNNLPRNIFPVIPGAPGGFAFPEIVV